MRLLMATYCIDETSAPLGFSVEWVRELARKVEHLYVITQWVGPHTPLPANVSIINLQKNVNRSKASRLLGLYFKLNSILRRNKIQGCFVHMHNVMTPILYPMLALRGIPIITWYAHANIAKTVPLAHACSYRIMTPSKSSYRYRHDEKVMFTGHGIDFDKLSPGCASKSKEILSVGRLSPVKGLETLLEAVALLREQNLIYTCRLVGEAPEEHKAYEHLLKTKTKELGLEGFVFFDGPISNNKIKEVYRNAHVHVNCGPSSNALDKAVIEASACGILSLTSIEGYRDTYQELAERLLFAAGDANSLASAIAALPHQGSEEYRVMAKALMDKMKEKHSLQTLIERLLTSFKLV